MSYFEQNVAYNLASNLDSVSKTFDFSSRYVSDYIARVNTVICVILAKHKDVSITYGYKYEDGKNIHASANNDLIIGIRLKLNNIIYQFHIPKTQFMVCSSRVRLEFSKLWINNGCKLATPEETVNFLYNNDEMKDF